MARTDPERSGDAGVGSERKGTQPINELMAHCWAVLSKRKGMDREGGGRRGRHGRGLAWPGSEGMGTTTQRQGIRFAAGLCSAKERRDAERRAKDGRGETGEGGDWRCLDWTGKAQTKPLGVTGFGRPRLMSQPRPAGLGLEGNGSQWFFWGKRHASPSNNTKNTISLSHAPRIAGFV